MTFKFSSASEAKLVGVHPDLVRVVRRALELSTRDFKVLEGVRSLKRQQDLYAQGRTRPGKIVTWTLKSNHFVNTTTGFGHAVDLFPEPYDWENRAAFDELGAVMLKAAAEEKVKIRWGADWDQDGNPRERGESDSPHFELAP